MLINSSSCTPMQIAMLALVCVLGTSRDGAMINSLKLSESCALITGGTGTIGTEITARLQKAGLDVIVACRKGQQQKCLGKLAGLRRRSKSTSSFHVESVDFASIDSTYIFLQHIALKYCSCLRVIVNAVAGGSPGAGLSKDGINLNFQVNVLSYFLAMTILSRCLQRNAPSSIVNIASAAAYYFNSSQVLDLDKLRSWTYSEVKVADIMLTFEAARRFRNRGIFVNAVHPGDTPMSTFISHPSESQIKLREEECCSVNKMLNDIVRQNKLHIAPSCCDSPATSAKRPVWLALNAPHLNLSASWWAKVYRMPSIFDERTYNSRLWDSFKWKTAVQSPT